MMMKYAGIVVLYNPDEYVFDTIDSYINSLDKIYLIDNTDDISVNIKNKILKLFMKSPFQYISMDGNKGIAAALNVGIESAIKDGYSWILTMDQDSSFANEIIKIYDRFLCEHTEKEIAILSPHYRTGRNEKTTKGEYEEIYWTMQSANLINAKIALKLGLFKEDYFIDCVDYEYCLRVKKSGYKIIRCNNAILNHVPATTKQIQLGSMKIKYGIASPIRIYYQVRNALYMFGEYKNLKSLGIVVMKFTKILLLFPQKEEYLKYLKKALSDYRAGVVGKAQ